VGGVGIGQASLGHQDRGLVVATPGAVELWVTRQPTPGEHLTRDRQEHEDWSVGTD
jgi:hypothetical protein